MRKILCNDSIAPRSASDSPDLRCGARVPRISPQAIRHAQRVGRNSEEHPHQCLNHGACPEIPFLPRKKAHRHTCKSYMHVNLRAHMHRSDALHSLQYGSPGVQNTASFQGFVSKLDEVNRGHVHAALSVLQSCPPPRPDIFPNTLSSPQEK